MKTTKHPSELSDSEAADLVAAFDELDERDYEVVSTDALEELRAAAAARRSAERRIEAAVLRAHRSGASWGVIGAQLGITRQGARQRFESLTRQ